MKSIQSFELSKWTGIVHVFRPDQHLRFELESTYPVEVTLEIMLTVSKET